MAKRPPEKNPPIQIKEFTPEEIQRAILKINRRIEQVSRLKEDRVKYNDQRRQTAEHDIRDTILEIFGPNSPEYNAHKNHSMGTIVFFGDMSDGELQQIFEEKVSNTITMLEGLIGRLKEKLADFGHDKTSQVRSAFEGLDLHARIATVCADLYRDGHYRNAVLDASVALVNMVKEKSRRHDLDGAPLMRTVFSKNDPILAFNDLQDSTDQDEQEGMMHLFEGAVLALRNPRAHTLSGDSPEEALEYIALLSFLAKKVDQAKRRK